MRPDRAIIPVVGENFLHLVRDPRERRPHRLHGNMVGLVGEEVVPAPFRCDVTVAAVRARGLRKTSDVPILMLSALGWAMHEAVRVVEARMLAWR